MALERKGSSRRQTGGQRKRPAENKCKACCRKCTAFMFSHVGLCALVVVYSIVGAFAFRALEKPHEEKKDNEVSKMREQTVKKLWDITFDLNVLYKENWTRLVTAEIKEFQTKLVKAIKDGYDGKEMETTQQWSFSGAFLYSLTVITTIDGYVILEGPEPFPVSRSSLLKDCTNIKPDPVEKPPEVEARPTTRVSNEEKPQKPPKSRQPAKLSKCELCGKLGAKSKLKRSKRFCSTSCCKRYNVGCSERLGIFPPANKQASVKGNKVVKKKKMRFKSKKGWRKSQGGRLAYNVSEWQNQNTSPQTDQGTPIEIESEE